MDVFVLQVLESIRHASTLIVESWTLVVITVLIIETLQMSVDNSIPQRSLRTRCVAHARQGQRGGPVAQTPTRVKWIAQGLAARFIRRILNRAGTTTTHRNSQR
jgi:hypothetical protein